MSMKRLMAWRNRRRPIHGPEYRAPYNFPATTDTWDTFFAGLDMEQVQFDLPPRQPRRVTFTPCKRCQKRFVRHLRNP